MDIALLPSDYYELVKRHKLLFRTLISGNTGVLNKISTIIDILLEKEILNSEMLKKFLYFP